MSQCPFQPLFSQGLIQMCPLLCHPLLKISFGQSPLYSLLRNIWCNFLGNFLIAIMAIFESFLNYSLILSLRSLRMSSSALFLLPLLIPSCYCVLNSSKRDVEVVGNLLQGHAPLMQPTHSCSCPVTQMLRRYRFFLHDCEE